jgi:hypothetical protein
LTLPGLELRPLGRPARSQSLYRLSSPGGVSIYIRVLPYASEVELLNSILFVLPILGRTLLIRSGSLITQ